MVFGIFGITVFMIYLKKLPLFNFEDIPTKAPYISLAKLGIFTESRAFEDAFETEPGQNLRAWDH